MGAVTLSFIPGARATMVSIGTVWDRTTEFVRDHQRQLAPVVFLTLFVPTVVSTSLEKLRLNAGPGLVVGLTILTVVLTLVSLWGQLFLTGYAAAGDGSTAAAGRASRRYLPMVGVTVVLLIAMGILFIPAGVIAASSGVDFMALSAGQQPSAQALGSLGWVGLYVAILGIVLLWLFARLMPLSAVVVMERRGLGAIKRAFSLTRGMGLKLVGLILLYGIVSVVAVSAVRFVFGSLLTLLAGSGPDITVGDVLTAVAIAALSAVLSTLTSVFVGKLYVAITGGHDKAAVFE